eukprot:342582-Alexandrium_andersonii.AAC.1
MIHGWPHIGTALPVVSCDCPGGCRPLDPLIAPWQGCPADPSQLMLPVARRRGRGAVSYTHLRAHETSAHL